MLLQAILRNFYGGTRTDTPETVPMENITQCAHPIAEKRKGGELSKPVEQNCGTASLQTFARKTPSALLNPLLENIFQPRALSLVFSFAYSRFKIFLNLQLYSICNFYYLKSVISNLILNFLRTLRSCGSCGIVVDNTGLGCLIDLLNGNYLCIFLL